ncbi:response regulator [Mariprofundus sp. KV]|uniref:hybrid sensor histidine kinase/response regulator n=1 Tax=Mariprofundus sp. KV TaxID=2608715 RepID=UPI0015A23E8A|nr:response regulator [Mariprofundus sp. KV]NWF35501.1 response regulator [Mariprofundus sp. KV]
MTDFDLSGFLLQFFDEAKERLVAVNRRLVLLESGKLDEQGLAQLCRDAHTIKGSAEMLGVKDISALSHLLEDAVAFVKAEKPDPKSHPMMQFIFDIHDQLVERLKHPDAEIRIDSAPYAEQFNKICGKTSEIKKAEQAEGNTAPVQKEGAEPAVRRRPRKPAAKKMTINRNLIAAVMGTIEGSLKKPKPEKGSDQAVSKQKGGDADISVAVEEICFRPDIASLEQASKREVDNSSGNFLRVDRSRLNRLSNQIIELSSDRYRSSALEGELDRLMQDFIQLRELLFAPSSTQESVDHRSEFDQRLRQLHKTGEHLRMQQRRSSAMLDDLRKQVFGLMLRPISSLFSVFPRTVRDLAARSGKKVQLLISGDAIEMDQLAAESLSEPLIHLINNAVAHGIETPEERLAAGKPEEAQITITARQQGTKVCIEVIDDGRGIKIEQLRNKAVSSGIISASEAEEMDSSEILELIFHPGFSTLAVANEAAGRGIGLNVVMNAMREVTGSVHIQTQPGKGTKFILNLPVSVAIQKANTFSVAGNRFGMLSNLIVKVLSLDTQTVEKGHGAYHQGYISYQGHRVPIIDLYPALNTSERSHQGSNIMIVEHFEGFLGVLVDEVHDECEIIVRDIDPYLKFYQPVGLMGNAIAEDGTVLLLIEPNGLKEMWRTSPEYDSGLIEEATAAEASEFSHKVLLVDDSTIALKIEKMIFESLGFTVETAVGGMDALEKIGLQVYQLMVTDMKMPGIDGAELIAQVRADERYAELPIMVIATLEAEKDKKRAMQAGANAFLGKRHLKGHEDLLNKTIRSILGIDVGE